jgi:hypothetical protein
LESGVSKERGRQQIFKIIERAATFRRQQKVPRCEELGSSNSSSIVNGMVGVSVYQNLSINCIVHRQRVLVKVKLMKTLGGGGEGLVKAPRCKSTKYTYLTTPSKGMGEIDKIEY